MTKALVFDLDNTLLARDKQVSEFNKNALRACLAANIQIVIATSRPKRAVVQFLNDPVFEKAAKITLNGAVFEVDGTTTQVSRIGPHAERIVAKALEMGGIDAGIEYLGEAFWQHTEMSPEVLMRVQSATPDMVIPNESRDSIPASKVAVDGCGRSLERFIREIDHEEVEVILADNGTFANIVARGVDKSTTLLLVGNVLGIRPEEMTSFGDDTPDIGMMKLTGKSVAMGNATVEVKALATTIIGDCDSNAIGQYIYEHVLGDVHLE